MPNLKKYFESRKARIKDKIRGNISIHYVEKKDNEEFSLSFLAGNVDIYCHHFLGEAYALNQCYEGLVSGSFGDLAESRRPPYLVRPLWCVGSTKVKLTNSLSCVLSSQLMEFDTPEKQELLCQRLIEMGYNALLIGGIGPKIGGQDESFSLSYPLLDLANTLAAFNLKLIIKPQIQEDFCPLSQQDRDSLSSSLSELQEMFPSLFAVFWESQLLNRAYAKEKISKEALLYDLVLEEVKFLEKSLNRLTKLIFYLPSQKNIEAQKQAEWFLSLSDEVGKNTILSFPTLAGGPTKDHLPLHPIWNVLRSSNERIHTPLMPIANFGSVGLGEGLWPSIPLRMFNQVFQRCEKHCFIGVASLSTTIPSSGGLLDCSLWCAGHLMWEKRAPELVLEQWFKVYRPDLDFSKYVSCFIEMDILRIAISDLQERLQQVHKNDIINDELRLLAESVLSRIHHLLYHLEVEERKNTHRRQRATLYDYFVYFARDLRRIVLHIMQSASLSTSGQHHEMDDKESFWTTYSQSGGLATRGSGTITLHEKAQPGNPGSKMRQIYEEKFMECGEVNV